MQRIYWATVSVLAVGASMGQAIAQEDAGADDEEIIVQGQREPGSVIGDIKPEIQYRAADIRALGVSSISELVTELSPETNSGGGAPVILLNGKRISSFSEISDLPSEAVSRVDILPEEVALSYGYAATQKVVNIVLRRRFRAEQGELRAGTTTGGGRENGQAELGIMRIRGDDRLTVNLQYGRADNLLESERGITATAPRRPYALGTGNVATSDGSELDPTLSALTGETVTSAAVPGRAASAAPSLSDFVAGANDPTVSNLGKYRTLSPATQQLAANITYARALGGVSMSVDGQFQLDDSDSLQGLPTLALGLPAGSPFSPFANDATLYRYLGDVGALKQSGRTTTGHIGVTLNGQLAPKWQWSFTGNADIAHNRRITDRGYDFSDLQADVNAGDPALNPYGPIDSAYLATPLSDRATSTSRSIGGDLLLSGPLFDLPAGAVTSSVRFGASAEGAESHSLRSGVARDSRYAREIASGQLSLDIPLLSRRMGGIASTIGDFGVNLNAQAQHLSDFGTLSTLGYGLRWSPVPQLRILASANQDRAAPTGSQITDPLVTTPNVSVFDYATGQTVSITRLTGGNTGLHESVRDQFRLSATVKPLDNPSLTLSATYLNSRTRNPIFAFPSTSPTLEAAFPDRFARDGDGNLTQIDARPVNFASARSSQLRWGFNLSVRIKSQIQKEFEAWRAAGSKPEDRPKDLEALFSSRMRREAQERQRQQGGAEGQGAPGARGEEGGGASGRPRFGGFGGGGRGGGGGGGRINFSLYHTWHFTDSILLAPGGPKLDLLNGDTTGSSGGQPRHEIQSRLTYSNNGLGARLGVNWESGTHVNGALGGTSRLDFGSLATVDLRLFANLGQMPQLVKDHPFLRGSRLSVSIDNIFNTRRDVRDATGATPVAYQPGYLDPLGRTITISFRKLFF